MSRRRNDYGALDGPIGPVLRRQLRSGVEAPDLVDPIMARVYARREREGTRSSGRGVAALMALIVFAAAGSTMLPKGFWGGGSGEPAVASNTTNQGDTAVQPQANEPRYVAMEYPGEARTAPRLEIPVSDPKRSTLTASASSASFGRDEARIGAGTVASQMESALHDGDAEWLAVR